MKSRLLLLAATAAQLSTASAALTVFTSFEGSASSTPNDLGFSSTIWASAAGGATNSAATFTPPKGKA